MTKVKASILVERSKITIILPTTGGRVILKGPRFLSPNFWSLFLDFTKGAKGLGRSLKIGSKLRILKDNELEREELYESSEEFSNKEDSEWDKTASKEEVKAPYLSLRVNARSLKLLSLRGAFLKINKGKTLQYVIYK